MIGGGVCYETAIREPLGDCPRAEMQSIRQAGEDGKRTLAQQRTSADPVTAEVRTLASTIQRCLLSMPAGESRDACVEILRKAAGEIKEGAEAAGFKPTAVRAAKQQTKWLSRPENRRLEVPLYPGRAKRSKQASAHRQAPALPPFPKLPKKGKATTKVGSQSLGPDTLLLPCGLRPKCFSLPLLCRCWAGGLCHAPYYSCPRWQH